MAQPTPPPDNGWHFKREVQVGHLITTLTIAASCLVYVLRSEQAIAARFAHQEQRIALLEKEYLNQRERDQRQDEAAAADRMLVRESLRELNVKLDRLLELKRR